MTGDYVEDPKEYPQYLNSNVYSPAKTRRYAKGGDTDFAPFLSLDSGLVRSPAFHQLTPKGQILLIAMLEKYLRHTQGGKWSGFRNSVPFTHNHAKDLGVGKSSYWDNIGRIQDLGFIQWTDAGRMASKGKRNKMGMLRLADAWKATLSSVDNEVVDKDNLPRMDDPRRYPKVMELCGALGEECIWGQHNAYAIKKYFSDDANAKPLS